MIKAVKFDFKGGFSQDSKIVIDKESNIEKRIESLCSGNYHCDHSEPKEVPLEEINIQELTALDLVNLIKLSIQEQYDEQFNRFTKNIQNNFQLEDNEVDQCNLACTPLNVVPGFSVMDEHDNNKCIGIITHIDKEADKVVYTDDDTKESVIVNFSDIKDRVFPF